MTTGMAEVDIEVRLRALVVKEFKLDPNKITLDARLDEMGVDSIGMAELIFEVEDSFNLKVPELPMGLSTFGEVVRFIEQTGANQAAAAQAHPSDQGLQSVA